MNTGIPTQADFQLPPERVQDLDGWHAWETFGGRSLDEAYAIFQQNAFAYLEDLMWMPPKPFCFYLPVAGRYLESPTSSGDSDMVSCLASTLEFHFERGHDISAAFSCIGKIADYVLSHYSKFAIQEHIYGDLRPRYAGLRSKIGEPDGAANGSQPIRSEKNGTSGAAGSRR